jgi:hypothetical protein
MAITTEKGITERLVNAVSVQFIGQETGLIQTIKTPSGFVIENGITTKTSDGVDLLGRVVLIDRYTEKVMPELTVTYAGANLEILALQQGKRTTKTTGDTIRLPIRRQASKGSFAGAITGDYGVDIAADPVGVLASAKLGGARSTALVQQPFATFNASTPLSFAIGAASALKFSDDLVAVKAIVELNVPAIVDTESIDEQDLDYQAVYGYYRMSNDSLGVCLAPTVQINPEGSKIDPSEDNTQVKASILVVGGCKPYEYKRLLRKLACAH